MSFQLKKLSYKNTFVQEKVSIKQMINVVKEKIQNIGACHYIELALSCSSTLSPFEIF